MKLVRSTLACPPYMDHPWLRTGPLLVQVDGRRLAAGGSLVFHPTRPHAHDTCDTVSDRTADTAHSLTISHCTHTDRIRVVRATIHIVVVCDSRCHREDQGECHRAPARQRVSGHDIYIIPIAHKLQSTWGRHIVYIYTRSSSTYYSVL